MSFGAPRPSLDAHQDRTPPLINLAQWALAIGTGAALAVGIWLLVMAPTAGLDLTDEGLYLLSADNQQPLAGHNGWFGRYTGLLFGAVGYDIGLFRVIGVLVLLAAATALGVALAGFVARSGIATLGAAARVGVVLGTASGALINYSLFIRTPGYNWLAFVAAALCLSGVLLVLAVDRPWARAAIVAGALIGGGAVLGLWAKASTGIGLAGIAAAIVAAPGLEGRRARLSAGAVAAAVGAVFVAVHFVFIADPAATLQLFTRSLGMVAVMDPKHGVTGATEIAVADVLGAPMRVVQATSGLVLLGLAPLVGRAFGRWDGWPAGRRAVAVVAPVATVGAYLLAGGQWRGGAQGYGGVALADLAILSVAALAVAAAIVPALPGRRLPPQDGTVPADTTRSLRLAYGVAALLAGAAVYAFGSANGFLAQTNGVAAFVLLGAGLLSVLPLTPQVGGTALSVAAAGISVISVAVLATGHAAPYRMPALETATQAIAFGERRQALTVDPATAAYWDGITSAAHAACWMPGTRLLDLTWSPAVPYALRAVVPETLIPLAGNFVTGTASAIEALRVSHASDWADAWLLTSPDLPQIDPATVIATTGARFPDDYMLVEELRAPGLGLLQRLWRPAGPLPSCVSAASP
jgi:hypothetical protein